MEFVGNKIDWKTILATLIVAFFIGRINLFNGTFPAAIAFITVMMGVSTVYIYLVPILILGIASYSLSEMYVMGDIAAIIICGLFFLFFQKKKFKRGQRVAVAVMVCITSNCMYYVIVNATLMFSFTVMVKEVLALIIFYEAFAMMGLVVFNRSKIVEKDKYTVALQIISVALIGTLHFPQLIVGLWCVGALICEYFGGINKGVSYGVFAALYGYIEGGYEDWRLLMAFSAGIICGRILADLIDLRYEKQIMAVAVFGCVYISESEYVYAVLIGMAAYAVLPVMTLIKLWLKGKAVFWWSDKMDEDIAKQGIIRNLKEKMKTFDNLGKIYGTSVDEKQIISYQFQGMARVVKDIIDMLEGRKETNSSRKKLVPIPTGSASYSFDGVSGDSQRAFYYGNKLAMVISDGMGKGKNASAQSTLVVTTLAELLNAGFDVDLAMKTVNGILMAKQNSDAFATVDLALVDRASGKTKIYKMGAATTFVKHNGKVVVIKQPALPAGIESGLRLAYQEIRLRRGDLLIMVSDGVCDCDRNDPSCRWLIERLESMGTRDPGIVAELIVNKAAEKYQLRERDDLTVLVAGI